MNGYTSKRFECNVEKRRVQAFYWWVEQWYSLQGAKVIEDFVIGMVLANSRFKYGAERRSKGNGTNEDFPVNLGSYHFLAHRGGAGGNGGIE